jgi:hypothetical protein
LGTGMQCLSDGRRGVEPEPESIPKARGTHIRTVRIHSERVEDEARGQRL